jgi:hypothetical protein
MFPTAMHPGPDRPDAGVTDPDGPVRRDVALPSHDARWR